MSGFVADPGTDFAAGATKEIAARLDALGKRLGVVIHGISGVRTPGHSIEVGGSANDPHTKGQAADIGVGGALRASAGQLTDAQLASVGLYRPFPGAAEINHVQIKPGTETKSFLSTLGGVAKAPLDALNWIGDQGTKTGKDANQRLSDGLTGAASDLGAAAGWGAEQVAQPVADRLVSMATDAIGKDLLRWTLYAALVFGGAGLVFFGGSRVLGAGQTTT
ncbi:MAG: hypothetical protein JWR63_4297 [Conexibacter sp.]|nr:hypothetical protein [Conexibacter sp.]